MKDVGCRILEHGKSEAIDNNLQLFLFQITLNRPVYFHYATRHSETSSQVLSFVPFKVRILSLRACDLELFINYKFSRASIYGCYAGENNKHLSLKPAFVNFSEKHSQVDKHIRVTDNNIIGPPFFGNFWLCFPLAFSTFLSLKIKKIQPCIL